LDETGKEHDMIWNTLIQVNVAQDEAKAGLEKDEVIDFLTAVKDTPHVRVHGLMTIGALEATQQETRGFFRELREIRDQVIHKGIRTKEDFSHLSMGMSQDYEIAVEEGATMIRVGSMIFGQR
jgi:pyridoxal phosphate enzyme (YggS family)